MNKIFPYLVIGFVWLLILILIDHTGEFPLIDDWAYAHGVKGYLDAGVLKISDWVAMTQVAHLFMGVGWVKVFGYSLEQLREMTLLVSFLGSYLFYWLTGYFSKSVVLRLVGTLIVVVNPIWMYLSHTFMTDVPFTIVFVALVGLIIYVVEREKQRADSSEQGAEIKWGTESREQKGRLLFSGFRLLKSARRFHLFPTTYYLLPLILVVSSILVLVRQTGLGLGFSFLLWVLLMERDRRGRWLGFGLVLVGVQVATLIGYEWFMASIDALSTRYHGASSLSWILGRPWWPVRAAYYVLIQLQYLGMFLLPLLPFVWLKWRSVGAGSYSRWAYVAAGVVVLGMGVAAGGDILMNPRYTHLMQYDTVGHVMTIDFTYERLEFSRDLYPLWVVLHGLGLVNVFLIWVVGSRKWGVGRLGAETQKTENGEKKTVNRELTTELVHKVQEVQIVQGIEDFYRARRSERAERAGLRGQGAESEVDTARRSRLGGLLFTVYRFLKAQHAFDHPVTWILLILGGYTTFISIGQFVFDRYLILHLPLMILVVLYLLEEWRAASSEQLAEIQKTENSKQKTENGKQKTEYVQKGQVVKKGQLAGSEVDTARRSPLAAHGFSLLPSLFSFILILLSFLFTTIGVHDSFEWNRVRFGAIEQLEAQGITPHQIDGGAEYNSWQRTGPLQPLRLNEKSWWYVDGDDYAIAHKEIPGYERISAHPFTRYYGLERDTLYVVKRKISEQ